jgi:Protein of unknown function (DUF3096)
MYIDHTFGGVDCGHLDSNRPTVVEHIVAIYLIVVEILGLTKM